EACIIRGCTIDNGLGNFFGQLRCSNLIVDAPAGIVIEGFATIGPPGVWSGYFACITSTYIDPVELFRRKEFVEVGALFRQKAGIFHVALPIFDVQLGMTNVEVTRYNRKILMSFHLWQVVNHGFQKLIFIILAWC